MAFEPITKDVDRLRPGELVLRRNGNVYLVLGYKRGHVNRSGLYRLLDSEGRIDHSTLSIMRRFQWKRLCRNVNEER